ncbi:MAG: pyruvate dehydrogenase complex dihydrolipoyllysine-residue acetyltransferase [Ktedonobacteraceae bacterium]
MYEFKLADLGEGMHEAEIVQWLIKEGDTTKLDQTIAKVETDKAIVELPSPVAGRVNEIRIKDGQTAKVGEVLVVFDNSIPSSNGGISSKNTEANPTSTTNTTMSLPEANFVATSSTPTSAKRPRALAAPAVRKLAFELAVDIEQIPSSNANGRISLDDVRAYAEQSKAASMPKVGEQWETGNALSNAPTTVFTQTTEQAAPPSISIIAQQTEQSVPTVQDQRQPLTGLRKRIAEHMERSWRTIPHATAFDEINGTNLIALRQALKPLAEQRSIRLTYMPLLVKLLIPVLKEFPIFNASLDEEKREIIYKGAYHIGIAADSPEGLLVPVLRNADHLTLLQTASKLEKLIEGAHKRTLALPELSGSTFTLNNVGSFGGGSGTPIINYPEVAILVVGRLQEKAVIHHGTIVARPMLPVTLSFDHRLIDGAMVGKFLARFKELLENPQQLMLDMV